MAGEVSAFISYSHDDMEFVDRLEADLRARGFVTWVDRRRLEGTYEWQPQIDRAIEQFGMVIVVVSPRSLVSEYVQHEYQYAHQLDKRIVPVLCKPISVPLPSEFGRTQYVDFVVNPYATALKELINGWQDPTFEQYVDSRTLYNQAHDLESTDPERAAILYRRLLDREPEYAGGRVRLDLERMNQQLYIQRAQRLREKAEAARKAGQYSEEAGALKALIGLGDQNPTTFAWAEEYLPVAQQNSKWVDTYENVKHCVSVGDKDRARDLLIDLWRREHAPFFRDPAGIASALGLKVPMTYEEWKERGRAREERNRQLANIKHRQDADVADEIERYEHVSRQIEAWEAGKESATSHMYLERVERELNASASTRDREKYTLLAQVIANGQAYGTQHEKADRSRAAAQKIDGDNMRWVAGIVTFLACAISVVLIYNWATGLYSPPVQLCGIIAAIVSIVVFYYVGALLYELLSRVFGAIYTFFAGTSVEKRVAQAQAQGEKLRSSAESAGRELRSILQRERDVRIKNIQDERDRAVSAAETQYQQHMAEIEARYPN